MAVGTGNFAELLWPGIKDLYGHEYGRYPTIYTKFTEKMSSDQAMEKFQGVTTLPLASVKAQGEAVSYTDPYLGYQTIIDPVVYAIGASVTREMYDDDQYSYINKIPKFLAESARQTQEVIVHNVLNNGFSSSYLGADGKALFDTSHPLVDGSGTFRNKPSVAADLTATSLESALIDIANLVDDRGRNILVNAKDLVVATDNRFQARRVLETSGEVDTGNNTINAVKGTVSPIVSPYLTDSDAWFIHTDVDNGIVYTERSAPSLERDNEFDTMNLKFFVWFRCGVGFVNPRAWWGSAGA